MGAESSEPGKLWDGSAPGGNLFLNDGEPEANSGWGAKRRGAAVHTGWMRSLALQLVRDSAGAEDLVQDTLVAALERRAAAGPGLGAWLSGVLRNLARGRFRSEERRRRRELLAARPEGTPSAADIVERADLHRRIVDAVLRLEEPYASAVFPSADARLVASSRGAAPRVPDPPGSVPSYRRQPFNRLRRFGRTPEARRPVSSGGEGRGLVPRGISGGENLTCVL